MIRQHWGFDRKSEKRRKSSPKTKDDVLKNFEASGKIRNNGASDVGFSMNFSILFLVSLAVSSSTVSS